MSDTTEVVKPKPKGRPRKKTAAAAQEAEAGDGFVNLEQCGVKLRIPIGKKVPIAAIDAFRDGDNYEGTRQMLGKDQWQALSDAGMNGEDLDELGAKLSEATGN